MKLDLAALAVVVGVLLARKRDGFDLYVEPGL